MAAFLSIFCAIYICSAQTEYNYSATFGEKAPGAITKAELLDLSGRKIVKVNISGGKVGCELKDFSMTISALDGNRSVFYEKIKGDKLSKESLIALKNAETGNKIVLSAFGLKCGKETKFVKQEFIYEVVE